MTGYFLIEIFSGVGTHRSAMFEPAASQKAPLPAWNPVNGLQRLAGFLKTVPASVFAAAALFAVLWLLGFPIPFVDDLFMIGAALNMAGGGDFSNPLITRQGFPSHYFFAQPPTHSYVLLGWLKVFGISAGSLTGFQLTMFFLTAAATIAILRRHSAPRWLEWLIGPAVIVGLIPCGLRMEPLAIALSMAGFAMIECGIRKRYAVTLAFFLMFMGGSAAPRTIFLPAAFVLLSIWRLARSGPGPGKGLRLALICATIALAITVVLFLWMIGFRLNEFLATFRFHTGKRLELDVNNWQVFLALLVQLHMLTQWPVLFLPFVAVGFNLLRRPRRVTQLDVIAISVLVPFALLAVTGTITVYTVWFAVFALLAGSASLLQRCSPLAKVAVQAGLTIVLFAACRVTIIQMIGVVSGRIEFSPGPHRAEALAMRSVPGHKVVVDSWVVRSVFGYRLPPDFAAFEFCHRIDGSFADDSLSQGDIYLVAPWDVRVLEEMTHLQIPESSLPMWTPFGVLRWSMMEYPCRVFIIPAESCNGKREVAGK